MIAIRNTNNEMAQLLIKNGANLNIQNKLGETALILSLYYFDAPFTITKLLIDNRANLDIKDNKEETALMIAILLKLRNYKIIN